MTLQRLAVYAEAAIGLAAAIVRYVILRVQIRAEDRRATGDAALQRFADAAELAQWHREHPDTP